MSDTREALPLVLCPGLVCDPVVWADQVAALSADRPCHVLTWGLIDSLGGMAEKLLDEVDAPQFALVGHSMGGRVAMEVVRRAAHRVARLALLDTGVHVLEAGPAGEAERRKRLALVDIAQAQGMRAMGLQWAPPMVHPSRRQGPLFESILQMIERSSPAQLLAQQTALLARPDAAQVLAAVQCPTLLLCGAEDGWSPPAQHQAMQQLVPHADLVVLPDCGHMATMEQPEAVTQALSGWLRR